MRAPKRRRPRATRQLEASRPGQLHELAEQASYILTPEHKDYLTAAGPGKLRSDATACPRGLDFAEVESWLKETIEAGNVSADTENDFPRYAWARIRGRVYEARLSNSGLGQYKGYPIHDHEAPEWLT